MKLTKDWNLQVRFPNLAKEWHPIKNKELVPKDVTPGSHKKVWWVCGEGHEWESDIHTRSKDKSPHGCPFCSRHRLTFDNSLSAKFPEIAPKWHPIKNGGLTPRDVAAYSKNKIWWVCTKGHEWSAGISNMVKHSECPYCNNNKVGRDNNLLVLYPKVAERWHPTKNGNLGPNQVVPGSKKKVWWVCKHGHERLARISSTILREDICPKCHRQYSRLEVRIYSELDYMFGAIWHDKSFGCEVDVFLPKYNIAIEVDGGYWHKDIERDVDKNRILRNRNIELIRVREEPLPLVGKYNIGHGIKEGHLDIVKRVVRLLSNITGISSKDYLLRDSFINQAGYEDAISEYHFPIKSFAVARPDLVDEWHPTKNGKMRPENVSYGSGVKMWWLCKEGHEWESTPTNMCKSKTRCPVCYRNRYKIRKLALLSKHNSDI